MFVMSLSCVSRLIANFNCPVNTASISAGIIFYMEEVRHCSVIHSLSGLTKYCQYASQFNLVICPISYSFSPVAYLHYFSSCLTFRRKYGTDSGTRFAPCIFSLIFSMIVCCCFYNNRCLFCLPKLRIPVCK